MTPSNQATDSLLDYSLTGEKAVRAVELGLAEADWYQCPMPRAEMRRLLERRDGAAVRDTLLWFGLILGFGVWTVLLWPNWWAVFPYLCYAVLYASSSDSRWHESSHGTAFKTDWMKNRLRRPVLFHQAVSQVDGNHSGQVPQILSEIAGACPV